MTKVAKSCFGTAILVFFFLSSCKGSGRQATTSATDGNAQFGQFVQHPTSIRWTGLIFFAREHPYSKTDDVVLAVERFTEASLKSDLPNSMAQYLDANEHRRILELEAEKQFLSLRPLVGEDLWQLTVALLSQNFDDSYYHACAEIVVRLFPSRYMMLKARLGEEKSAILNEEYERWGEIMGHH